MQRVARDRVVLFVNSIGMRMPLPGRSTMVVRRILRKARSIARLVRRPVDGLPNFYVMTPLIVPFYGQAWARALNARLVAAQVGLVARFLRMHQPVCIVTIPTAWEVLRFLPHRRAVYNRSDLHSAFGEADTIYIRSLEHELLAKSARVMYVSVALMNEEAHLTGERAWFLDHGVDLGHFRRRQRGDEPHDLRDIPHPRIGFFGGFDDYIVDLSLLERVAREIPEAQLVLIGDANCSMRRFEHIPNVHWLGYRPYEDIPRYGSGFDVALMPWLNNDWIRYANPIKMKEYLALELPVVSMEMPQVRLYERWIRIARDPDEFVALVRKSLQDGGGHPPAAFRQAVASSSWDARASELLALCEADPA